MVTKLVLLWRIYQNLKDAYPTLRPELKKLVNDPKRKWDNYTMYALDTIFTYEEK